MQAESVSITVDGKVVKVPAGVTHFREIVSQTGAHPKTNKITVVSTPTPASSINGNDSFQIVGGEVFTTTHG